jgi:hypothetical protein
MSLWLCAILINTSLSNSSIYHMSMFLMPKTTMKNLDKMRRRFFWQGGSLKKKYHLVKWSKVCKDKNKGGLGIKDPRKVNTRLLCKWWWALQTGDGLWQEIVKLRYIQGTRVCLVQNRMDDSSVWKDLIKIRHIYMRGREYVLGNGRLISFWLDTWLGGEPLCRSYPILYELAKEKKCCVYDVANAGWVVHFRLRLPPIIRDQWYHLAEKLDNVRLSDSNDKVI